MMKLLGENPAASSTGACSVSGMSRECAGAMQQLLNSMLSRKQGKGGFGGGQGDGGGGLMNGAPMFGPQREKFQQSRPSREGAGEGSQKGEGGDGTATNARHSSSGHKDEEAGRKQEKTPGDGPGQSGHAAGARPLPGCRQAIL